VPVLHTVAVLAVYVLSGKLGFAFASLHASATPVWPPAGIALAAMLLLGIRMWPAIFVGAFVVNITTAGSVLTSLGIAGGNTLEALLGAYLVVDSRVARPPSTGPRTSSSWRRWPRSAAPR
jgi:integral membrane sensor domain MASE1